MAMMSPLEWQQWAQGAQRGQQSSLSRLLPYLQAQAQQQAYQGGGTEGLLQGGFFPQAQQASAAQANQSVGPYREALARKADAEAGLTGVEANVIRGLTGGGTGGGAPGGGGRTGLGQIDQLITLYNTLGRTTEGLRAQRKSVGLRQAFSQPGDYFTKVEFLERNAPDLLPDFVKAAGGPSEESMRGLGNRRAAQIGDMRKITAGAEALSGIDLTKENAAGWEFAMAIIMNQILQPQSAVLIGEAAAMAEGLQGQLQRGREELERIGDATSPEALRVVTELRNNALKLAELKAGSYLRDVEGWENENERWRIRPGSRGQVMPGKSVIGRLRKLSEGSGAPAVNIPAGLNGEQWGRLSPDEQAEFRELSERAE